ncbi:MAG: hypothetical protein HQL37_04130 [Alphaproteobacteria bacterium]|nr:hypothetical protein [Alphaproteobacteria bacterium]
MSLSRVIIISVAAGMVAGASLGSSPASAAGGKTPPACAAISFRPVPPGMADGEQDAGLYKSRFGKIEIKAMVKGGAAQDYYMTINGKRPTAMTGPTPKSADACFHAKHVKTPVKKQEGACTGSRFRVVIHNTGDHKLVAFFGLQGDDWQLCSASTL